MAKKVEVYEADDGSRFDSIGDAQAYERKCLEVDNLMRPLGEAPDCIGFANGKGYIQHHASLAGCILDGLVALGLNRDSTGALGRAHYRIMSIDPKGREFGQPYYALNLDKATMVDRTDEAVHAKDPTPEERAAEEP